MGTPLKNPPAYLTVAQVRFNALLQLADYLPVIQEAMRKGGYPDFAKQNSVVLQTNLQDGQAMPNPVQHERYKFGDIHRTHAFWLDSEGLTLQSTDYGHFDKFTGAFLAGLRIVDDTFTVHYTERIGLRYLDRVIPREGEDVSQYLAPAVLGLSGKLPGLALHAYSESVNKVEDVMLRSRVVIQGGRLSFPADVLVEDMVVEPRLTDYVGPHAIIDNDGAVELREIFSLDVITRRLKAIHDVIDQAFKAAATPHVPAVTPHVQQMADVKAGFGRTISRLPEVFGVSRQTLYNWRDGETPKPAHQARLAELAEAARFFTEVGFKPTALSLDRTVAQGRSLLQLIREGAAGRESARKLVRIEQRGTHSRDKLDALLRSRKSRPSLADMGNPFYDEKS